MKTTSVDPEENRIWALMGMQRGFNELRGKSYIVQQPAIHCHYQMDKVALHPPAFIKRSSSFHFITP
jgi:hypothetical protein